MGRQLVRKGQRGALAGGRRVDCACGLFLLKAVVVVSGE